MAMQVGATNGEIQSEINTTPLIDVMLVLLVMLIITIPPQRQAVQLDTPAPPTGLAHNDIVPIHVRIDFDGIVYWDGSQIETASLDQRMRSEAEQIFPPEILIEPHRLTKYRDVAAVMAAAQRAGLSKLAVIGGV